MIAIAILLLAAVIGLGMFAIAAVLGDARHKIRQAVDDEEWPRY